MSRLDPRLIDLLVCPLCKGPLKFFSSEHSLVCCADGLSYPVRNGIPVLIQSEAVPFDGEFDVPHK
ncbi:MULTISPECIES: Trm112 family protein [Candidatus Ichthyocystis]|uniref:Trm112 family protein n=1 Tax=Candidatus Ichthyocystis TaxID=2929841 RepID=UPI000B86D920|nr:MULTISPECIES: Trm112 family protein [Ichthyocystis]